jgi:hypothetical protein
MHKHVYKKGKRFQVYGPSRDYVGMAETDDAAVGDPVHTLSGGRLDKRVPTYPMYHHVFHAVIHPLTAAAAHYMLERQPFHSDSEVRRSRCCARRMGSPSMSWT